MNAQTIQYQLAPEPKFNIGREVWYIEKDGDKMLSITRGKIRIIQFKMYDVGEVATTELIYYVYSQGLTTAAKEANIFADVADMLPLLHSENGDQP